MVSTLINYITDKFLSDILEIDKNKTKTSLISGTIELENIKIKKSLFESLNLPFIEIKHGFVGKIHVSFSPLTFWKSPIVIKVSKIHALAKQKSINKLNEKDAIKQMEENKSKRLKTYEEINNEMKQFSSEPGMIEKIIGNISVQIEDIVVRFEDEVSYPQWPYAFGLVIESIFIKSTNSLFEDNPDVSNKNNINITPDALNFKLIKIINVNVYLDYGRDKYNHSIYNPVMIDSEVEIKSNEDMLEFFKEDKESLHFYCFCMSEIKRNIQFKEKHSYLLWKFSSIIKLTLNTKPKANFFEQIALILEVPDLIASLSLRQITVIMKVLSYISLNNYYMKGIERKYYRKKVTKDFTENYADLYIEYYKAKYDKKLKNHKEADMIEIKLKQQEEGFTINQIIPIRDVALLKYSLEERINNIEKQEHGYNNRFRITSYFTSNSDKAALEELANQKATLKKEESENLHKLQEIYKKKEKEDSEENLEFKDCPRDYKQMSITLIVSSVCLSLSMDYANYNSQINKIESYNKDLIKFGLTNIEVNASMGGRVKFMCFTLSLEDMYFKQFMLDSKENLIYSTNISESSIEEVVSMGSNVEKLNILKDQDINMNNLIQNFKYDKKNFFSKDNDNKDKIEYSKKLIFLAFLSNPEDPVSNIRVYLRNHRQLYINLDLCSMLYIKEKIMNAVSSEIDLSDLDKYARTEVVRLMKKGKYYTDNVLNKNTDQRFNILLDTIFVAPLIVIDHQSTIDLKELKEDDHYKDKYKSRYQGNYENISVKVGILQAYSNIVTKGNTLEYKKRDINLPYMASDDEIYDQYFFKIKGLSVSLGKNKDLINYNNKIHSINHNDNDCLFDPMNIEFTANTIIDSDERYKDNIVANLNFNKIKFKISDLELKFLIEIMNSSIYQQWMLNHVIVKEQKHSDKLKRIIYNKNLYNIHNDLELKEEKSSIKIISKEHYNNDDIDPNLINNQINVKDINININDAKSEISINSSNLMLEKIRKEKEDDKKYDKSKKKLNMTFVFEDVDLTIMRSLSYVTAKDFKDDKTEFLCFKLSNFGVRIEQGIVEDLIVNLSIQSLYLFDTEKAYDKYSQNFVSIINEKANCLVTSDKIYDEKLSSIYDNYIKQSKDIKSYNYNNTTFDEGYEKIHNKEKKFITLKMKKEGIASSIEININSMTVIPQISTLKRLIRFMSKIVLFYNGNCESFLLLKYSILESEIEEDTEDENHNNNIELKHTLSKLNKISNASEGRDLINKYAYIQLKKELSNFALNNNSSSNVNPKQEIVKSIDMSDFKGAKMFNKIAKKWKERKKLRNQMINKNEDVSSNKLVNTVQANVNDLKLVKNEVSYSKLKNLTKTLSKSINNMSIIINKIDVLIPLSDDAYKVEYEQENSIIKSEDIEDENNKELRKIQKKLKYIEKKEEHKKEKSKFSVVKNRLMRAHLSIIIKSKSTSESEQFTHNLSGAIVRTNVLDQTSIMNIQISRIVVDILNINKETKLLNNLLNKKLIDNIKLSISINSYLDLKQKTKISNMYINLEPLFISLGIKQIVMIQEYFINLGNDLGEVTANNNITVTHGESEEVVAQKSQLKSLRKKLIEERSKFAPAKDAFNLKLEKAEESIIENAVGNIGGINSTSNISDFNNLSDIRAKIDKISIRIIDNTSYKMETPIVALELNQFDAKLINNSNPNDTDNLSIALVEIVSSAIAERATYLSNKFENPYHIQTLFQFINVTFSTEILFYNAKLTNWEPLMEKLNLEATLIQVIKKTRMKLGLFASNDTNFNITPSIIKQLLDLKSAYLPDSENGYSHWYNEMDEQEEETRLKEIKQEKKAHKFEQQIYIKLVNTLGIDIQFWFEANKHCIYNLADCEEKVITKNDSVEIYKGLSEEASTLLKHKIGIKFRIPKKNRTKDEEEYIANYLMNNDDYNSTTNKKKPKCKKKPSVKSLEPYDDIPKYTKTNESVFETHYIYGIDFSFSHYENKRTNKGAIVNVKVLNFKTNEYRTLRLSSNVKIENNIPMDISFYITNLLTDQNINVAKSVENYPQRHNDKINSKQVKDPERPDLKNINKLVEVNDDNDNYRYGEKNKRPPSNYDFNIKEHSHSFLPLTSTYFNHKIEIKEEDNNLDNAIYHSFLDQTALLYNYCFMNEKHKKRIQVSKIIEYNGIYLSIDLLIIEPINLRSNKPDEVSAEPRNNKSGVNLLQRVDKPAFKEFSFYFIVNLAITITNYVPTDLTLITFINKNRISKEQDGLKAALNPKSDKNIIVDNDKKDHLINRKELFNKKLHPQQVVQTSLFYEGQKNVSNKIYLKYNNINYTSKEFKLESSIADDKINLLDVFKIDSINTNDNLDNITNKELEKAAKDNFSVKSENFKIHLKSLKPDPSDDFDKNFFSIYNYQTVSKKFVFFVEFIIINRLDYSLLIKDTYNKKTIHKLSGNKVDFFSSASPNPENKKIQIACNSEGCEWSEPTSLSSHGLEGVIAIQENNFKNELKANKGSTDSNEVLKNSECQAFNSSKYTLKNIAVLIKSSNEMPLSTLAIFEPRYIIVNQLEFKLMVNTKIGNESDAKPSIQLEEIGKQSYISIDFNSDLEFDKKTKQKKKMIRLGYSNKNNSSNIDDLETNVVNLNELSFSPFIDIDSYDENNVYIPVPIEYCNSIRVNKHIDNDEEDNNIVNLYCDNPEFNYVNPKTKLLLVNLSVKTKDNGLIYVIVSEPQIPKYKVKNDSKYRCVIKQRHTDMKIPLEPRSEVYYAFTDNTMSNKSVSVIIDPDVINRELKLSFDKVEKAKEIKLNVPEAIRNIKSNKNYDIKDNNNKISDLDKDKKIFVSIVIQNDNRTRTIKIEEYSKSDNTSEIKDFIARKKKAIQYNLSVHFECLGISLIDSQLRELFFVSLYCLDLKLYNNTINNILASEETINLQLFIKNFQVDYCLDDSFKILLYPKKQLIPAKEEQYSKDNEEIVPFMQILVTRKVIQISKTGSTTIKFPQIDFTMQELCVKVDQNWINRLLRYVNSYMSVIKDDENNEKSKIKKKHHDHNNKNQPKCRVVTSDLSTVVYRSESALLELKEESNLKETRENNKKVDKNNINNFNNEGVNINTNINSNTDKISYEFESNTNLDRNKNENHTEEETNIEKELCLSITGLEEIVEEGKSSTKPNEISGNNSQLLLVEYLLLSAIRLSITLRIDITTLDLKLLPKFAVTILGSVGNAVARITDAPLKFNELVIENCFSTKDKLANTLQSYYTKQGATQFYKILGSSDLLGNPVGLVDKLGTGVMEFFNEPRKGFMNGPSDFGIGIAKGVKSLLSNVVGGSLDTVGKITGTLLSFTKDLRGEHQGVVNDSEPDNIADGLYTGLKGGVKELGKGLAGIVMNPYRRGRTDGVVGFFKGLGTGLLGAFLSPVAAVLTIGNNIVVGSKNTVNFNKYRLMSLRYRHPRFLVQNELIKSYEKDFAEVQEILRYNGEKMNHKIIFFQDFVFCDSDYSKGESIAIVTDKRIFVFYEVKTSLIDIDIRLVNCVELHIINKKYLIIFILNNREKNFVYSNSLSFSTEFYSVIDKLIKALNEVKKTHIHALTLGTE